jgi:hypothetical protein
VLIVGAAAAAVFLLRGATATVDARLIKPPYCAERCSGWRPCTKLCRLEDETVTTCGDYGVCKQPDPIVVFDPITESEPPPAPTPTPLPCPSPCTVNGTQVCPAIPGFTYRGSWQDGLSVAFDGRPEGVDTGSSYDWTFDGTATAQGQSVEHTFAGTGPHTVVLTVTDSVCNSPQSRTIQIDVPPVLDFPPILPSPTP